MRIAVVVVVTGLFVLQGFGILFNHDHPADVAGHQHQFASHGDGHYGHAEDVVESAVAHADASLTLTPAATGVAIVGLLCSVAVGLATLAGQGRQLLGPWVEVGSAARPPPSGEGILRV